MSLLSSLAASRSKPRLAQGDEVEAEAVMRDERAWVVEDRGGVGPDVSVRGSDDPSESAARSCRGRGVEVLDASSFEVEDDGSAPRQFLSAVSRQFSRQF